MRQCADGMFTGWSGGIYRYHTLDIFHVWMEENDTDIARIIGLLGRIVRILENHRLCIFIEWNRSYYPRARYGGGCQYPDL